MKPKILFLLIYLPLCTYADWFSYTPTNSLLTFKMPDQPIIYFEDSLVTIWDGLGTGSVKLHFVNQKAVAEISGAISALGAGDTIDFGDSIYSRINLIKNTFLYTLPNAELLYFDTTKTNIGITEEGVINYKSFQDTDTTFIFMRILVFNNDVYLFSVECNADDYLYCDIIKEEYFKSIQQNH